MSEEIENQEVEQAVEEKAEPMISQKEFNAAMGKLKYKLQREYEEKFGGVDVEEYAKLKAADEEREMQAAKERGEIEAVFQKKLADQQKTISELKSHIHTSKVKDALRNAAITNNAVDPNQVVALLEKQVRLNEQTLTPEVLDDQGALAYSDEGQPLPLDALVKDFMDRNAHFQRATTAGTGSKGAAGGSTQKQGSVDDWVGDNWSKGGKEKFAEWLKTQR